MCLLCKLHTALHFCHACLFLTATRCAAHRRRVEHPAGRHFKDHVYEGRTRGQNGLLAHGPHPAVRDYCAISPRGPAGSDWQKAADEGTSAGHGAGNPAGSSDKEDSQGEHHGALCFGPSSRTQFFLPAAERHIQGLGLLTTAWR